MDNHSALPPAWPPAYTVKKHPRAKRIRLRASLHRGLEVVIPPSFNLKNLPLLLEQNRQWIEKQLSINQAQMPATGELPSDLIFNALNRQWKIYYQSATNRLKLCLRPQQELILYGNLEDKSACKRKLLNWVRETAKEHLLALLECVSLETGLCYRKSGVRSQWSRWGSCSRNGSILLNYKLIFLPPALVRHTLIHELCHTVHFNHSSEFWNLVAHHDPAWRENRRALKKADCWIPKWLLS